MLKITTRRKSILRWVVLFQARKTVLLWQPGMKFLNLTNWYYSRMKDTIMQGLDTQLLTPKDLGFPPSFTNLLLLLYKPEQVSQPFCATVSQYIVKRIQWITVQYSKHHANLSCYYYSGHVPEMRWEYCIFSFTKHISVFKICLNFYNSRKSGAVAWKTEIQFK